MSKFKSNLTAKFDNNYLPKLFTDFQPIRTISRHYERKNILYYLLTSEGNQNTINSHSIRSVFLNRGGDPERGYGHLQYLQLSEGQENIYLNKKCKSNLNQSVLKEIHLKI